MASQPSRRDTWQGMNWVRQEKRLAIYIRDNFTCAHCKRDLRNIQPGEGIRIELDHIIPVSKGGGNNASNLVTSCSKCNASRGDKDLEVLHPLHSEQQRILKMALKELPLTLAKQVLAERKRQEGN